DPEYLAELSSRRGPSERVDPRRRDEDSEEGLQYRLPAPPGSIEIQLATEEIRLPDSLEAAVEIVKRQAAQCGEDPLGFIASLRRGESVSMAGVSELAQA